MSAIIERIKKLLALANNAGATEHEAARALDLAQTLMMKHGIEASALGDKASFGIGDMIAQDHRWQFLLGHAVAHLYGVKVVKHGDIGISFAGRLENNDAAAATLPFIVEQVERLYKAALPKGLSKTERGEFRRTFKEACAMRVLGRVQRIVAEQVKNDAAATGTSSTALVVRKHREQLNEDAQAAVSGLRSKPSRAIEIKQTSGAQTGYCAGDRVRINREVR